MQKIRESKVVRNWRGKIIIFIYLLIYFVIGIELRGSLNYTLSLKWIL